MIPHLARPETRESLDLPRIRTLVIGLLLLTETVSGMLPEEASSAPVELADDTESNSE